MSDQTAPAFNLDVAKIAARAREVVTNPKGVWAVVRAENLDIPSIYREYLLALAAIAPVAALVVGIYAGQSVFSSVVGAGVHYGLALGFYFAAAVLIELLGPRFESSPSREDAFRWIVFAAFPALISGALILLQPLLGALASFAMLALAGYSIYILWEGMSPMLGTPHEKRGPFFICIAGCAILYGVLLQSL